MWLDMIAKRRKELKWTIERLSKESGVPFGTLNKILSGQTKDPKFDTLRAICDAMGLSLTELSDYQTEQEELIAYAKELHERPEMKALFSLARKADKKEVEKFLKMLEAMKD